MKAIHYDVPFFANTADNTHCYQACIKMIAKFFRPELELTWEELDIVTAKQPGMWTWSMAGLTWLHEQGFMVRNIEVFDYPRFIKDPHNYLVEIWGDEVAQAAEEHSIVASEVDIAKKFIEKVKTEQRLPEIQEIPDLLEAGNLIIANVNSKALNELPGYTGHFVVIIGYKDGQLIVHDPGGTTGHPSRKVSPEQFTKAWAYPDNSAKSLVVIRKA